MGPLGTTAASLYQYNSKHHGETLKRLEKQSTCPTAGTKLSLLVIWASESTLLGSILIVTKSPVR